MSFQNICHIVSEDWHPHNSQGLRRCLLCGRSQLACAQQPTLSVSSHGTCNWRCCCTIQNCCNLCCHSRNDKGLLFWNRASWTSSPISSYISPPFHNMYNNDLRRPLLSLRIIFAIPIIFHRFHLFCQQQQLYFL